MNSQLIPVLNYQQTNPTKLLSLTEKLFHDNVFELYLTPQQLIVLEYLISLKDQEMKLKVWNELLNGNMCLKMEIVSIANEDKNEDNDADESALGDKSDDNVDVEADEDGNDDKANEDELSQLDLDDLKQHISGPNFVGNLSLKLRYVLWKCAIDAAYNDTESLGVDDDKDPLAYVLLDEDNDDENGPDNTKNSSLAVVDSSSDCLLYTSRCV